MSDDQSDVTKIDVTGSSVTPHNQTMTSSARDQMVTSTTSLKNETEDLEQMTKELLQINFDTNGKVRLLPDSRNSGKHLTRESVLKQPLTSAVLPSTKSRTKSTELTVKENNKNMTDLSDIIGSALNSNLTLSVNIKNVKAEGLTSPLLQDHKRYQNSTIEDTGIVNSVIKSVSTQIMPSQVEKQEKGDRKANLAAPFFNQNNPILTNRGSRDNSMTVVPGKRKLNSMQNELLMEMFKVRSSSSGKPQSSEHSKVSDVIIFFQSWKFFLILIFHKYYCRLSQYYKNISVKIVITCFVFIMTKTCFVSENCVFEKVE